MRVADQRRTRAVLSLGKRPGAYFTEGWVGPKAGLDGCGKSRFPPGFDPLIVQPVARPYVVRSKKILVTVKIVIITVIIKNINILYIVAYINTVWKQKGNINLRPLRFITPRISNWGVTSLCSVRLDPRGNTSIHYFDVHVWCPVGNVD
jgi:hypothetical protein